MKRTDEDWGALRFEAGQLFTPSTPVAVAELFAGRQRQLSKLIDTISERGRHVLLYGERGVGKTSIANIIQFLMPMKVMKVRYIRKAADPSDTFSTLWLKVFRDILLEFEAEDGSRNLTSLSELYADGVTSDDVVRELAGFSENDIPIIVFDEFNQIESADCSVLMANAIKALSDAAANVTVIVVGVADNVDDLIGGHESISRCTEEINMPRMTSGEMQEILEKRLRKLGMSVDGDAKWKMINLSKGLPAFVHGLGKAATVAAISKKRLKVAETDVDVSINDLLESSQQTLKNGYEMAVRSNQPNNFYRQVITACALATADDSGYFTPMAVKDPLSGILRRPVEIATFQDHLREFIGEDRGRVLQRVGRQRAYRFRFRNPAMQPYVVMRGIRENLLTDEAKRALSCPEQGELFSSG